MLDLIDSLARYRHDPLGYARWAFPWGEPGPLQESVLKPWQEDALGFIGESLRKDPFAPIRLSRATGHGVGKSALGAIISKWAFDTCVDTRGVVTANTENQLRTKTWVELAKWNRLAITAPLCKFAATSMLSADPLHERTWRLDMVPWSEHNTEAFAGLHNQGRRVFLLMDEASAIADVIWEVAEGALTDSGTEIIQIAFGNPTRNRGRFRDTFPDGKFGRRWNFRAIDARDVEGTNKRQIEEWAEDYGEHSDFFRVRVRGLPPENSGDSFISRSDAVAATARPLPQSKGALVLGVDVARFGDDLTVIWPRAGLDARSHSVRAFQGFDTQRVAWEVRDAIVQLSPVAVFIDDGAMGAGVVDALRHMRLPTIIEGVSFGAAPVGLTEEKYLNRRAEMWGALRTWIKDGGVLPSDLPIVERGIVDELIAVGYGFANEVRGKSDAIQLESKRDVKRRAGFSPDFADALALTFARPIYGPAAVVAEPIISPDYNPITGKVEYADKETFPGKPNSRFERWPRDFLRGSPGVRPETTVIY